MITDHAKLRMKQRKISKEDIAKCLKRGKEHKDDYGRTYVRKVDWNGIVVIVDIVKRDVLTVWRY